MQWGCATGPVCQGSDCLFHLKKGRTNDQRRVGQIGLKVELIGLKVGQISPKIGQIVIFSSRKEDRTNDLSRTNQYLRRTKQALINLQLCLKLDVG